MHFVLILDQLKSRPLEPEGGGGCERTRRTTLPTGLHVYQLSLLILHHNSIHLMKGLGQIPIPTLPC